MQDVKWKGKAGGGVKTDYQVSEKSPKSKLICMKCYVK